MAPRAAALSTPIAGGWTAPVKGGPTLSASAAAAAPGAAAAAAAEPAQSALTLERISVQGSGGAMLSALVADGRRGLVGVVLLPPHPSLGGCSTCTSVDRALSALANAGYSVLAPDWRGSGGSGGRRGYARVREREDVFACVCALQARAVCKGVVLVGFSFGAVIGMSCADCSTNVRGLACVGYPFRMAWALAPGRSHVSTSKPKLFVAVDKDYCAPLGSLHERTRRMPGATKVATVGHVRRRSARDRRAAAAKVDTSPMVTGHGAFATEAGAHAAAQEVLLWVRQTFGDMRSSPTSTPTGSSSPSQRSTPRSRGSSRGGTPQQVPARPRTSSHTDVRARASGTLREHRRSRSLTELSSLGGSTGLAAPPSSFVRASSGAPGVGVTERARPVHVLASSTDRSNVGSAIASASSRTRAVASTMLQVHSDGDLLRVGGSRW